MCNDVFKISPLSFPCCAFSCFLYELHYLFLCLFVCRYLFTLWVSYYHFILPPLIPYFALPLLIPHLSPHTTFLSRLTPIPLPISPSAFTPSLPPSGFTPLDSSIVSENTNMLWLAIEPYGQRATRFSGSGSFLGRNFPLFFYFSFVIRLLSLGSYSFSLIGLNRLKISMFFDLSLLSSLLQIDLLTYWFMS